MSVTFTGPLQLCFSVEQHVCALFALELLLYVRLPDGGHRRVIKVEPVATLLTDKRNTVRNSHQSNHKMFTWTEWSRCLFFLQISLKCPWFLVLLLRYLLFGLWLLVWFGLFRGSRVCRSWRIRVSGLLCWAGGLSHRARRVCLQCHSSTIGHQHENIIVGLQELHQKRKSENIIMGKLHIFYYPQTTTAS